ncbi:hypothetical protein ES332_A11G220400v1 [Gossypium tomentosum]|uniref:HXXXD-type acyl-transferase family protein n=1 Tax=Gossypium tomentosum TaxID=34277 RepID=A0A5D2NDP2_GOSTO|nr:hypothetical protein ES332_A11G220400v1 [Gossypium tomentosum]
MVDVRFISSSIIQAANHSASSERIELTPWDLRFLQIGHIQKGLLFPKPKAPLQENDTENTLIHHLKTFLSHTLHYFPPLAGQLAITQHEDDTISLFINCNNARASFTHAVADGVTISDIIKPVYVPTIIHSFFPLNELTNFEGTRKPVLGIQVTDLIDGIFIGCTNNHVVVDGTSFWHFLNSWSEISKGLIHLSKPLVFQRWFPDDTIIPIPRSVVKLKQSNKELESILPANTEMGTNNISSLQALLSHIWRLVICNKRFDPNEEITYRVVVGCKRRLSKLPDNCFRNVILGVFVTMKAKELLEKATENTAWTMNRKIATVTEESSKMFFESWTASPKFVTMSSFRSNSLTTSISPRFYMYGNKFEGKTILFCGVEEGSIDIEVCLFAETMGALAIDEEFMDVLTL